MSDPAPTEPTPTPEPTPSPTPEPQPAAEPSILNQPPAEEALDLEKLTYPDGLNKDHESFKNFTEFAKEAGFKQSQVQRMVDLHHAALKATSEAIYGEWRDQQTRWVDEVKRDAEIGNTDEVRRTVGRILDDARFSDPKFREALDFTGAGNHPAVVRTLYRMAKALSEGGLVNGAPASRAANGAISDRPSPAASIYGPEGPFTGGPNIRR